MAPPIPSSSSSTPSRHDRAHQPKHRVRSSATPTRVSSPLASGSGSRRSSGPLHHGEPYSHGHGHGRNGYASPSGFGGHQHQHHSLPDRTRTPSSSLRRSSRPWAEEEEQSPHPGYGYGHGHGHGHGFDSEPPGKARRLADDLDTGSLETPSPGSHSTRESSEARARFVTPAAVVAAFKTTGHYDSIRTAHREIFIGTSRFKDGPGPGAGAGAGSGSGPGPLKEHLWNSIEALLLSHLQACPDVAVDIAKLDNPRLQWLRIEKILDLEDPPRAPIDDGQGGTYVPPSYPEVLRTIVKQLVTRCMHVGDGASSSHEDADSADTQEQHGPPSAANLWGLDRAQLPDIGTLVRSFTKDFVDKNGLLYADSAPGASTPASASASASASAPQQESKREDDDHDAASREREVKPGQDANAPATDKSHAHGEQPRTGEGDSGGEPTESAGRPELDASSGSGPDAAEMGRGAGAAAAAAAAGGDGKGAAESESKGEEEAVPEVKVEDPPAGAQ